MDYKSYTGGEGIHTSGSSSMLTEEQKLKMQAAIEIRQAEKGEDTSGSEVLKPFARKPATPATDNGGSENSVVRHEPKATLRANPAPKQERKSHSTVNGKPKKAGAGGKGTWGDPLDLRNYECEIERGDPLYDSDEHEEPLRVVAPREGAEQKFKRQAASLIAEFFASADVDAAAADLAELNPPHLRHLFVKRLLSLALDRHNKHKELAVELISAAYPAVLSSENIEQGFLDLLASVQDLELDCPNAGDAVASFLARAVVDDVLPPAFLTKAAAREGGGRAGEEEVGAMNGNGVGAGGAVTAAGGSSSGRGLGASESSEEGSGVWQRAVEVIRAAEAKLKDPLHALALEQVWGGPPGTMSYDAAKGKIQRVLDELVGGGEKGEAMRRIRELELPFFHHEVVKAAVTKAMENPSKEPLLLDLLKEASEEGVIAGSQVASGFSRLLKNIDDLQLDLPGASDSLQRIICQASKDGWLPVSFKQSALPDLEAAEGAYSAEHSKVLREFKSRCTAICAEYFDSGDASEAGRSLDELAYPDLQHHFLKRLVIIAMERGNREKELASLLLASLSQHTLPVDQIKEGFLRLLESLDDLSLDVPDAGNQLALFMARAVIDDVLPPQLIHSLHRPSPTDPPHASPAGESKAENAPQASDSSVDTVAAAAAAAGAEEEAVGKAISAVKEPSALVQEVTRAVEKAISAPHAAERLMRCWGSGAAAAARGSSKDAKDAVAAIVEEYLGGGEVAEAMRCIRELNLPFFHHEIVKRVLVRGMEARKEDISLALLTVCSSEGLISTNQMIRGFLRVAEALPDLVLDIPDAPSRLAAIIESAKEKEVLPNVFAFEKETVAAMA